MFNEQWRKQIKDPRIIETIEEVGRSGDFSKLETLIEEIWDKDEFSKMVPGGAKGKYKVGFTHTLKPKIIPAVTLALKTGMAPVMEIVRSEAEKVLKDGGWGALNSPQDFVYAFTSERYEGWGELLAAFGFQSACMSGTNKMLVTVAPRLLELGSPDTVVDELFGAIPVSFLEAVRVLNSHQPFLSRIADVIGDERYKSLGISSTSKGEVIDEIIKLVEAAAASHSSRIIQAKASCLLKSKDLENIRETKNKTAKIRNLFKACEASLSKTDSKQEQVVLKFIEEGRFLQKLLNGLSLVDIQSNVKMVPNILRGNKCEVDRIYRVIGEKKAILVEAKAGRKVSRTQLYQLYETYRMKLPQDWDIEVVAVLLRDPDEDENIEGNVSLIIDVVQVSFDDSVFGDVTESVFSVSPKRHVRWEIKTL